MSGIQKMLGIITSIQNAAKHTVQNQSPKKPVAPAGGEKKDHQARETWIPLKPDDQVFRVPFDGDVVVLNGRDGLFGAVVRDGKKRVLPLTILDPKIIIKKEYARDFRLGEDFLKFPQEKDGANRYESTHQ